MKITNFLLTFFAVAILFCCIFYAFHRAKDVTLPSDLNFISGQSNKMIIPGWDVASQTNLHVIVYGGKIPFTCPAEYEDSISNTNLFSPDVQKLLSEIPLKFANVTPTSGPLGTVLVHSNFKQNGGGTSLFKWTNSGMQDEVYFGGDLQIHKVRDDHGDGYDVSTSSSQKILEFSFRQINGGRYDGLFVDIFGTRCMSWMRFNKGLAVDKWLAWDYSGEHLLIYVEFKKPYDYLKATQKRIHFSSSKDKELSP